MAVYNTLISITRHNDIASKQCRYVKRIIPILPLIVVSCWEADRSQKWWRTCLGAWTSKCVV